MKLYNTRTKSLDTITPQQSERTTVYTCGPTVYDYPHIGNWFTFIRYDMLIRTLRTAGLQPDWVMNITDVGHLVSDADDGEDKLEKGARREHKTAWDIAAYYGEYFIEGLRRLNITAPSNLPKATDHIAEQIALVQTLEDKGYTYRINDGIYFDTSRFPRYADFAQLDLSDQKAGARVEYNQEKRNPSDFALWKFTPADQTRDMEWDSPWGRGFPGWHLECSAMAMKYLGNTLDIHAGGIDHIPVHHTNEIAQSEAATGERFVQTWMHTNHISVDGEKISKSLSNGITLEDICNHNYDLEAFRILVLESHYRSQSKFSWESMTAAQNRLESYRQAADRRWQAFDDAGVHSDQLADARESILGAMTTDLESPIALARLSEIMNSVNDTGVATEAVSAYDDFLHFIDALFGTTLAQTHDISADQKMLVLEREAARQAKDWATSDALREQLAAQNIVVRDTDKGTIWQHSSWSQE